MMKWLNDVYLETTDPKSSYTRLMSSDVLFSVVIHSIGYVLIIYILQKSLNIFEKMNLLNLFLFLLVVMTLGFIARLCRSKCVFESFMSKTKNNEISLEKTKELMNNAYFTWYFLS